MPNPYFRFKKFTIHQDRSAMKVCTDSCILGAWTGVRLSDSKRILDIGTGTALLALMLAQKSDAGIDAIETDPATCEQAGENIRQSPWPDRVRLLQGDARRYTFTDSYDFIITNPPFFESDLLSPSHQKNKAKHNESLSLVELMDIIISRLQPQGAFSILLPFHRDGYFEELASSKGFFLREKLIIRQTPAHQPFRTVSLFGFEKPIRDNSKQLTIKNAANNNSAEFTALMMDYYD